MTFGDRVTPPVHRTVSIGACTGGVSSYVNHLVGTCGYDVRSPDHLGILFTCITIYGTYIRNHALITVTEHPPKRHGQQEASPTCSPPAGAEQMSRGRRAKPKILDAGLTATECGVSL